MTFVHEFHHLKPEATILISNIQLLEDHET